MKVCKIKGYGHPYKFCLNCFFLFEEALKYGDFNYFLTKFLNMAIVQNVEVMLGQTLNHSVYNSVIL
jgi:hypothetical protein